MFKTKKYLSVLLIILILCSGISVNAEEENKYKSTIQINYGYMFDDGSMDVFATAPGIIINSNTVLTYNFIDHEKEFKTELENRSSGYEALGIEIKNLQKKFSMGIYTGEGRYIPATYSLEPSGNTEFLILTTEEPLENAIVFSPKNENNDKELYATGFSKEYMDCEHFLDSTKILTPTIKVTEEDEKLIKFSIDSSDIYTGGAIINGNNELYGLIIQTDNGGRAIPVNELREKLDKNNIMYSVGEAVVPINYEDIHTVTDAAKKIDEQIEKQEVEYTEDSQAVFTEKYVQAKKIAEKKDVKQEEVDVAARELDEAIKNLEEVSLSDKSTFIIILIVICIIIILIIVIVILYIEKRDLLYKLLGVKKKADVLGKVDKKSNNFNANMSNGEIIGKPYIIRIVNASRIVIDKDGFTVGRDFGVDCRISDNISVSKCHCMFKNIDDQWFIVDNGSSNKTFVNGIIINPNQPIALYDKTEIMLGNEKFIFRYVKESQEYVEDDDINIEVPDTGILANDLNNDPIQQTTTPFFTDLDKSEMDTSVLPGAQNTDDSVNPWL